MADDDSLQSRGVPTFGGLPASVFFRDQQNASLVARARQIQRALADDHYLRVNSPGTVEDGWSQQTRPQLQMRIILDGLLQSRPPEARPETIALAARVEAVAIPAHRALTHTLSFPEGFIIGVGPIVTDLLAEVQFLVQRAFRVTELGAIYEDQRHIDMLSDTMLSWIRVFDDPQHNGGKLLSMRAHLFDGEDWQARPDAILFDAMWDIGTAFSLVHELSHIDADHFERPASRFLARSLDLFVLSDELRSEVEADLASFTSLFNYFVCRHYVWFLPDHSPLLSAYGEAAPVKDFSRLATALAVRYATEAMEAFYLILIVLYSRPSATTSDREALSHIQTRKRFARDYVKEIRSGLLSRQSEMTLWQDSDELHRQAVDKATTLLTGVIGAM